VDLPTPPFEDAQVMIMQESINTGVQKTINLEDNTTGSQSDSGRYKIDLSTDLVSVRFNPLPIF
jgi:hypothetical protein